MLKKPRKRFLPQLYKSKNWPLVPSISADLVILSLFWIKLICVKSGTSRAYAGPNQCSFSAAQKAAYESSAAGPDRQICPVSMPAIKARFSNADVTYPSVSTDDALNVSLLSLGICRRHKHQAERKQRHHHYCEDIFFHLFCSCFSCRPTGFRGESGILSASWMP